MHIISNNSVLAKWNLERKYEFNRPLNNVNKSMIQILNSDKLYRGIT